MDDSIIAHIRKEEAELLRKLEAVQLLLAAYGAEAASMSTRTPQPSVKPKAPRAAVDRTDKFGAYGQRIIDAALRHLPQPEGNPMMTRELLAKLDSDGIEVRGENKINALSALLARSSKVKGFGRAGWARAEHDDFSELLEDRPIQTEEKPHSEAAGGSSAADLGVGPPGSGLVHSNWGRGA